jgi:hypothetical protein
MLMHFHVYNKIHALANDIGQPNHKHMRISDSKVVGPHRNTCIRRYPKELKALVTNTVRKFSSLTNNNTIYNTGLSPLPLVSKNPLIAKTGIR